MNNKNPTSINYNKLKVLKNKLKKASKKYKTSDKLFIDSQIKGNPDYEDYLIQEYESMRTLIIELNLLILDIK